MAFQIGDGGSSSGVSLCIEDNGGYDLQNGRKSYHRHPPKHIQRLEAFYKVCPHPDKNHRRQLGVELGLEPRQIKFWFQNKRTQVKAQNERAANDALRSENDRIRCENTAMLEALENAICSSCGGSSSTEEERMQCLQKLQQENSELKMAYEKVCNILAKYMGRPMPGAAFNSQDPSLSGQGSGSPAFEGDSLMGNMNADNLGLANLMKSNAGLEKSLMTEIAASAMDELIKLLRVDQPLWIKSSEYDQYILDQDNYQKIFSRSKRSRYPKSRMESSKDSGVVNMGARSLVDLYLNPDKWAGIFPGIVYTARTIHVFKAGLLRNQSGALQLIYEQRHILTPFVQPREFYVLRYCQQLDIGLWVIVDVSFDYLSSSSHDFSTCSWKYPSGCMIHEMRNGLSKVTCIEHVEVDDNIHVHPLYEDLVKSAMGFGARRWITALQRAVERHSFFLEGGSPEHDLGGGSIFLTFIVAPVFIVLFFFPSLSSLEVNASSAGRRSIIMLARRLVKSYCSIFSLLRDFRQSSELMNNEIQIAYHKSSCSGRPIGIIVSAATSFWVPTSSQTTFQYLSSHIFRYQWDILCNGYPVHELMRIPTGSHLANCVSILQSIKPSEDIMLLQECTIEPLGSYVVYAPFQTYSISEVAAGLDSEAIPILASGFAVNCDVVDQRAAAAPSSSTRVPGSGGSLITLAFQQLVTSSLSVEDVAENMSAKVEGFVIRTARVVKAVLACYD